MMPVYSSMNGGGNLKTTNIIIENFSIANKIADLLKMPDLKRLLMGPVNLSYEFVNGKVHLKPFELSYQDINANTIGWISFDQTIDFEMAITIPRTKFCGAANSVLENLVNEANKLGTGFKLGEKVNITAKITGTTSDPVVKIMPGNGSGKSTLAKHLNALLVPTQGDCVVHGMSTKEEKNTFPIRSLVAMVFQNPENQIVGTVVEEDTAFGPENQGSPPKEIEARVETALRVTGLIEKRKKPTYTLSGGEKQRVALASTLTLEPEVLVLDEPTSQLDPEGAEQILALLTRLNREQGLTIVLSEHRLERILPYAETKARMKAVLTDIHTPDDAALVADKLIETMRSAFTVGQLPLTMSLSIGISLFPGDDTTVRLQMDYTF